MAKPVLEYWGCRGAGAKCRLALIYTGTEFEDREADGKWFSETKAKFQQSGHGLANLPYFKDGEQVVFQSQAIMNHIARKHGLDGKTEVEKANIDSVIFQVADLQVPFSNLCWHTKKEDKEEEAKKYVAASGGGGASMARLEAVFNPPAAPSEEGEPPAKKAKVDGPKWVAGTEEPSIADLTLYEAVLCFKLAFPSEYEKYPGVAAWFGRMAELEGVKAYEKANEKVTFAPTDEEMAAYNHPPPLWGGSTKPAPILA